MNCGMIGSLVALGTAGMEFAGSAVAPLYPPQDRLIASPGGMTYAVDPVKGDDANPAGKPWKSMEKVNML